MAKRKKRQKTIAGSEPTGSGPVSAEVIDKFLSLTAKSLKDKYDRGLDLLSETYIKIDRVIPLDFPALEEALGYPGWPLSTLVEIRGRPSAGKTTFMKWLGGRAQACGVLPNFQDTEGSGVQEFDEGIGLVPGSAVGSKARTFEEVFDKLDAGFVAAKRLKTPMLGIFDSVAATLTREDFEKGYDEEGRRARRAAFLSANLPRLLSHLSPDTGLVFINQVRQNQDRRGGYGPKWTSPGGMALEHFCHMRIEMAGVGQIREGGRVVGMWSKMRVIKSKISPPHKSATLAIYFDPPRVVGADAKKRTPVLLEGRDPEDETADD